MTCVNVIRYHILSGSPNLLYRLSHIAKYRKNISTPQAVETP